MRCELDELEKMYDSRDRIVDQTEVGHFFVSTVFLCLDHGFPEMKKMSEPYRPLVFETMIKNLKTGEWLDYQERYHTYQEAQEGHKKAVQCVNEVSDE